MSGKQVFGHVSQWGNLSHLNLDIFLLPVYLRSALNFHDPYLSFLHVPSAVFKDLFLLFLNYELGVVMCM